MNKKVHKCAECNILIPAPRVKFLIETGVDPRAMRCVLHTPDRRIKAIYSGEVGTSPLIFCDKVYNDSVKQKFVEINDTEDEDDFID